MTQDRSSWCWQLRIASFLIISGAITLLSDHTFAQLLPDSTLPNNSSVTNQGNTSVIEGGTQAGANLFHSFTQFSIPTRTTAYFNNAPTIQNIFSRVTGGSTSNIDGVIKANGTANLFLLNSNGIIFGPNARLDIKGSFLASTARSLNFADGNQFSSTVSQPTPLLTVSVPIGLQFGVTAKRIRVQGSNLEVKPDKTLALVGGDITLEGGEQAALEEPNLVAPGGRIELGSVAGGAEVSLSQRGSNLVIGYNHVNDFRDIRLADQAFIDTSGSGSGGIQIQSKQLDLTQGSYILADTQGAEAGREVLLQTTGMLTLSDESLITADVSGSGSGGDVTIQAGSVALTDGSQITADVLTRGTGTGGNLAIKTGALALTDSSRITSDVNGSGSGGDLTIQAGSVTLTDGSQITADALTRGTGTGGDLTIQAGQLRIGGNESLISVSTYGQGSGGNLVVNASDSVELFGGRDSGLFAQAQGSGTTGNVNIFTKRLSVQNQARVSASSNQGQGGNLSVTALESIKLVGLHSGLFAQTLGTGSTGNLTIATRQLSVKDGAQVSTAIRKLSSPDSNQILNATWDEGQRGNLSVTASDSVELLGRSLDGNFPSGLFTITEGAKDAGSLTITTRQLVVGNGARVSARTSGLGKGGELRVNATDSVNIFGVDPNRAASGLSTRTSGVGKGGDIIIDTSSFRIADNAVVDARALSAGNGGNIIVKADTFEVVNGGQLVASTFTGSNGRAGNISVNTTNNVTISGSATFNRLVQLDEDKFVEDESANSGLFVRSSGLGDAGTLQVQARSIQLNNKGEISAETASGQGGDINLQVQDLLLLRNQSQITTNAGGNGDGGNINVDTNILIAVENSSLSANAIGGKGGQVQIAARGIFLSPNSRITASSALGAQFDGVVEINTPDVDFSRSLIELPVQPVETEVAQVCQPGSSQAESEFVVTGRGGLPPSPSEALSSNAIAVDWVNLKSREGSSSEAVTINPTNPQSENTIEAQGWVMSNNGQVILTAAAPTVTPHSPWQTLAGCN